MNTKSIAIICATVFFTVILIGILFWPTLYRYDRMTVKGSTFPVRINRLTGYTEYFVMGKWIPQESNKKSEILPPDERIKVTWDAGFDDDAGKPRVYVDIYNGSSWTITDMIIRLIAKEEDGSVRWERKFKKAEVISPLSTGRIYVDEVLSQLIKHPFESFEWSIEEIRGYKED